ncbi:hypothetical protein Godav_019982, partial [Gossypium davidsonii]|nr:hypothetical protein [Gossypium davidsonii]
FSLDLGFLLFFSVCCLFFFTCGFLGILALAIAVYCWVVFWVFVGGVRDCWNLWSLLAIIMEEDISISLEKLSFLEEETKRLVNKKANMDNSKRYEHWAIGKLMTKEKVNREVMYRVVKSLSYTKEEVNFVAIKEGGILVKFCNEEDRKRILNLSPWLFGQ